MFLSFEAISLARQGAQPDQRHPLMRGVFDTRQLDHAPVSELQQRRGSLL